MRPPWDPSRDSGLRWTWLDNFGPFITNREVRVSQTLSSGIESDSVTEHEEIMFVCLW